MGQTILYMGKHFHASGVGKMGAMLIHPPFSMLILATFQSTLDGFVRGAGRQSFCMLCNKQKLKR